MVLLNIIHDTVVIHTTWVGDQIHIHRVVPHPTSMFGSAPSRPLLGAGLLGSWSGSWC
jgi:hypothetical protein